MLDAIAAGDVILQPFPRRTRQKPGCGTSFTALFIPVGATNPEGAKEFINWTLSKEQNPTYVLGPGAGLPVLKSVAALPAVPDAVLPAGDCG